MGAFGGEIGEEGGEMKVSQVSYHAVSTPADLAQYAGRTLDFLNTIEKTIKHATRDTDVLRALANSVRGFAQEIQRTATDTELDPEGRTSELLVMAAAAAKRSFDHTVARCESARADRKLREDDGVVECLAALRDAFADLHAAIEEFRDVVELHDALRSPVTGTYTDVEALIASLKS